MKYSQLLIDEVDRLYHNKKLNQYAEAGDEDNLGKVLREESERGLSGEYLLDIIEDCPEKEAIRIIKKKAQTLQDKKNLYLLWQQEYDEYKKNAQKSNKNSEENKWGNWMTI